MVSQPLEQSGPAPRLDDALLLGDVLRPDQPEAARASSPLPRTDAPVPEAVVLLHTAQSISVDRPSDARHDAMRDSLDTLVRLIERVAPGMRGSVLLLGDDGTTLHHGAAPNLPEAYCRAIDGAKVGPAAGSCGTAVWRGEQVIVRDIATDPLWADYRAIAEPHALAACWSTPIVDTGGKMVGTFAMYYGEPREPTAADLALTETATHLAANVIIGARALGALRMSEQQLRTSQEQLHAALDASSTSTWRWDMRTGVVEGDEGLFRLFGVDPAESAGSFDVFVTRIHGEDRERVVAAATRCATEGADLDEEFRVVRPDGTVRWVVDKGKTVPGDDGKPQYLIGACVDVTERRVQDEQFRVLAESIPHLAWMADVAGHRDWFNQRWYDYTGATRDAARGLGWLQFHHPEHRDRVLDGIRRAWPIGEPWEDTVLIRGTDGRHRWFLSRARPIRDADGVITRWFGTSTDIDALREAELARDHALAEAKAERERLYEVFMQAPAAIAVLEGPDHVFTVANPLYEELIGGRPVLGTPVRAALPELAGQGLFEELDAVYSTGRTYLAREYVIRLDRDGDGTPEEFYVDFVYQSLKDTAGQTFGVLVHAVDVTSQVHARQEIVAARAEAERSNRAKSEFLAAMSHDLRTPLNAIGGYADLAAEGLYGPVTEAQRAAMGRIRRAGNHLLSLINDILSFAKLEAGHVQLQLADLAVNEIVSNAGSMVELQAANKGIAFAAIPGPELVRVRADRERLTQILTNLLTNAMKFTDAGSIVVEWSTDERSVRIDVRDTGRGIPSDRLAAIFEPFVQVGRSKEEKHEGVGLGLAISRNLARAMGGELTVASVVAQGSTFTLELPRAGGG